GRCRRLGTSPIVDDLRRNPDVQRRDFRHGVLPSLSSGDVGGSFGRTRIILAALARTAGAPACNCNVCRSATRTRSENQVNGMMSQSPRTDFVAVERGAPAEALSVSPAS